MEAYGSYQLLKRLATGGMAQIYLARPEPPEPELEWVVVKRILPHLAENEEFVQMFLDEARIAARLNHANIVQIFNLGAQDDSFFIAMEYIHGEDVRRVWKRAEAKRKELPVELVCRILLEASAGIDYAHKRTDAEGRALDIVHRDISPQNILVTFQGGVKVVDFGIAKAADQATITRSGVLKGKYSYMSPEQAAGQRLDGRSDIFALGVVLYELLTGTRLFKRPTDLQTLNAVLECDVMAPSQVNSRCPKDLDPVVMQALARQPDERYQEALELQVALEKWLAAHRLGGGAEALSRYMRELYADRLAAEAEAGGPVIEPGELLSSRGSEPGKKRSPSKPSKPAPSKPEPAPAPTEQAPAIGEMSVKATTADRPASRSRENPLPRSEDPRDLMEGLSITQRAPGGPPELTLPLEEAPGGRKKPAPPPPRRSGARWWLALAGLLAGAGVAGYFAYRAASPGVAVLHVVSDPPGATVVFDGHPVAEPTPCTLPPVSPGSYLLVVGKSGYQDYRGNLLVPESGEIILPVIHLPREPSGAGTPP